MVDENEIEVKDLMQGKYGMVILKGETAEEVIAAAENLGITPQVLVETALTEFLEEPHIPGVSL